LPPCAEHREDTAAFKDRQGQVSPYSEVILEDSASLELSADEDSASGSGSQVVTETINEAAKGPATPSALIQAPSFMGGDQSRRHAEPKNSPNYIAINAAVDTSKAVADADDPTIIVPDRTLRGGSGSPDPLDMIV